MRAGSCSEGFRSAGLMFGDINQSHQTSLSDPHRSSFFLPVVMQYARAAAERAASAASAAAASARGTSSAGADDSGSTTSRYSILSVTSLLSSDPDKTHDYKVKGVAVDSSITEMKDSLRRLRTTLESAATFYAKYAEPPKKPSTTTSAISAGTTSAGVSHSLSLPELAEWPKHELFCGSSVCSEQLFLDASRLAVIEDLMVAERSAIGSQVVSKLREGVRMAIESLEGLYAFELQLRDATHALEAAQEALKRGGALADIAEAQRQMKRLQSEAKPVALDTARARRQAAETGPICDAATTLANAYHDFVRGSTAVVHQQQPSVDYNPSVVRKAPKEKDARFAAYIMQWTLAKRRCKSSAALLEEFVKLRLETLLAPAKEAATLEALAAEVDDKAVKAHIEAVRLPEGELAEACGACRTAVETLVDSLGACRQLFKARAAAAEEFETRDKDLKALQAKRDAVSHEVEKLEAQSGGQPGGSALEMKISKKRIDLQALTEECERRAAALEAAAEELEGFATELASDQGARSVVTLVGQPLSAFLAQYGAFCATRGRGSATAGAHADDHEDVSIDAPETVHTVVAPPPPPPAPEPDSLIAFSNREEPPDNPFGAPAPEPEALIAFSPPARSKPLDPFAAQPNPFAAQPDPFAAQPDPFAAQPDPFAAPPAAAPPAGPRWPPRSWSSTGAPSAATCANTPSASFRASRTCTACGPIWAWSGSRNGRTTPTPAPGSSVRTARRSWCKALAGRRFTSPPIPVACCGWRPRWPPRPDVRRRGAA